MAQKTIKTRIQNKIDSHDTWSSKNPVLLNGELAIATVQRKDENGFPTGVPSVLIKVGNGTSHYNDLDFTFAKAADVYDWAKAKDKPVYTAEEISGLEAYIGGKVQDSNTTYKLEQDSEDKHILRLYAKELGAETWGEPIAEITTPDTVYDDTQLRADIKANGDAIAAEKERAMGVEGGLETRLAAVEADYLVEADKEELAAAIAAEETRAKAAEKVNADAIAAIKEDIDAFFLDADMTESAKDSLKEIQEYINSDVQGAAAMAESINSVKDRVKAIEDDYLVEADKTELTNAINGKVAQGDHDALAGRVTAVEGAVATKAEQVDLEETNGKVAALEGKVDVEKVSTAIATAKNEAIAHADGLNTAMNGRVVTLESHALLDTDTIIFDCGNASDIVTE